MFNRPDDVACRRRYEPGVAVRSSDRWHDLGNGLFGDDPVDEIVDCPVRPLDRDGVTNKFDVLFAVQDALDLHGGMQIALTVTKPAAGGSSIDERAR